MAKSASITVLEADPDDPEDFPVTEQAIETALAARRARRVGRPKGSTTSGKSQVTLRIDTATLERFRATGPRWQSRINEALARAVQ